MEVEFKAHPAMNSGIQIRSHCFANPTEFKLADGKIRKIAAERVHGYQVEIDPSKTRHSGGIYDEARRRWLVNLKNNPTAREAFKPNEWNHLRIKCDGLRCRYTGPTVESTCSIPRFSGVTFASNCWTKRV